MGVMVSISCTTYNQEAYIAQALDSFLVQVTDFDFEILVHDDASTDGTAAIVREYERRYPGLIRSICQTENQYSRGVRVDFLNAARGTGKYFALCEGDDYWTDPSKLQRQVDVMESDLTRSLCVHSSLMISREGDPIREVRLSTSDGALSFNEIFREDRGIFATSSMLFPSQLFRELPEYFFRCPVGDWPLALYLYSRGGVYYIDRQMSAYRVNALNSWTERMRQDGLKRIRHHLGMAEMLLAFDRSTRGEFSPSVRGLVEKHEFFAALLEGDYRRAKHATYARFYRKLGWRSRLVITTRLHVPGVAKFLASAKRAAIMVAGRDA